MALWRLTHLARTCGGYAAASAAVWLLANPFELIASDRMRPFRAAIDLITVDVCVRDAAGRFIPTLNADDFVVLENGKPQQVQFFTPGGHVPLRAVLVIDRSASMRGLKLTRAIEAASQFAAALGPEDQLEVVAFNEHAIVIHPFDRPAAEARASLSGVTPAGMTALNEALLVAADHLARARRTRGADVRETIVLLSDGDDTASSIDFQEVLVAVRRSGVIVYGISLRTAPDGKWLGANWPLLQLAADTGGRAVGVTTLDALPDLYREIDAEVRHLYRLAYVPKAPGVKGEWRSISVRVPGHDARIRARTGYYASRPR